MKPLLLGALAGAILLACSSDSNTTRPSGTGGTSAGGSGGSGAGGSSATGGSSAAGGSSATGGKSASGGSSAAGGTASTGGLHGTGGKTGGKGGGSAAGGAMMGGATGLDGGPTGGADASTSPIDSGATGGQDGGDAPLQGDSGGVDLGATGDASTLSAGCGKTMTRPDRKAQQTISIDGTTRYYLLNVPSNFDNKTPLPMVFALHGYDMNNIALVDAYDFTSQSGNKAITVLPQGEGPEPGNVSHWGDGVLKSTWSGNAANYNFMQKLQAEIEGKYCIDTSRVFMTGFSMGGMFTNSLACEHNDWFRGYAPVEGGGPNSCANANAKPAIIVHQGTADTIAKPSAGEGTRDFWLKQNGCSQTTTSIYTGCQSYGACAEPVIYCVGNWDHQVSQTARANIWSFFNSLK